MTFTEVFGGTTIYPSGVSYRAVALSANQTLAWPVETATNANIVAQIMDVTPSIAALSILMPPANEASVGETTLFFNAGSFAFTVKDNGGNTIVSIAPGLSYQVYLIGNSTVNGTWRSTQYAAGTSSATAGSLVGAGIKAINTTLNQSMAVTSLNSNYTIGDADRSEAFLWSGGAGTLTLPSALSVGNDWFCHIRNSGTGAISLATTGGQLINGALSLAFNPGDSAIVICDGSGFFTIGFGQSASFAFDYVSIDLTSQASPYTLAGANLNRIAYSFGGTLTANMTIHIPATFQQYWLANETLGGFAITVKVAGQTGVIIGNGVRAICYCNGTDLVDADTSSFSFPVSISQGGTGATNESGARVNLGGTSTGIAVFTAPSAASARSTLSAAASGANSDITSLSGLTTPLSVGQGGTGTATAFTAGSVVFGGASGVYSQDNANFFWDDTNNRLGIGTATPLSNLNVSFSPPATVPVLGSGTGALALGPAASYGMLFGTIVDGSGYIQQQRFDGTATTYPIALQPNGGNVGVGTSSPANRLTINDNGTGQGFSNAGGGNFNIGLLAGVGSPLAYVFQRASSDLLFGTNNTERMRITSAGDVGIGTSAPANYTNFTTLDLNNATNGGLLNISKAGATVGYIHGSSGLLMLANATDLSLSATGVNTVQFLTNSTERMRVTGAGLVGIGTSAPGGRLEILNNGINLRLNTTFVGGNSVDINPYVEGISNSGFSITVGSNIRQVINSSGNVGIGVSDPTVRLDTRASNPTRGIISLVRNDSLSGQTGAQMQISQAGIADWAFGQPAGVGDFAFWVGRNPTVDGAETMRITSAGNVGIGTTPSAWVSSWRALDVNAGGGALFSGLALSGISNNAYFDSGSNWRYKGSYGAGAVSMGSDGSISILNAGAGTAGNIITFNTRIYVSPTGDVGIGNTSPGQRFSVGSTSASAAGIDQTTTTTTFSVVPSNSAAGGTNITYSWSSGGQGPLRFSNASAEVMRLDASGNLGIGTVSPATRLHAAGITRISDATNSTAVNIDASTTAGLTSIIAQFGGSQLAFGAAGVENFRITSTGGITSSNLADAVGYKGLPQNSQTSGYTLALSDMGKHISITTGGVTIPANGAVAFPIGAAITIFNNSGTPQNIGITTDTLRQAGTANTGSRTLAQYGVATVLKVTSTVWVISGAGLS